MSEPNNDLLTVKELAAAICRNPSYVYKMREQGFQMPGGVATVAEARTWLAANNRPWRVWYERRKVKNTKKH